MRRISILLLALCASLAASVTTAKPYKGAEIYSNQSYLYGRYEMRMRVANASGVLSTFFTYKNGSEIGIPFGKKSISKSLGKIMRPNGRAM